MAGRKEKSVLEKKEHPVEGTVPDPEAVPKAEVLMEETTSDLETVSGEESKMGLVPPRLPNRYKITCRNDITKQIGGVDFENGVGYTADSYAASWFAAKDGYTVEPAEEE